MRTALILAGLVSLVCTAAAATSLNERVVSNSSSSSSSNSTSSIPTLPIVEISSARNGLYQSIEWNTPISKLVDSAINKNKGSGNLRVRAFGDAQLDPRGTIKKKKETPAEHKKEMAKVGAEHRRNKHLKASLTLRAKAAKERKAAKLAAERKAKAKKAIDAVEKKTPISGKSITKKHDSSSKESAAKKTVTKKETGKKAKKPVKKTESKKKENSTHSKKKKSPFAGGSLAQIALKAHNELRDKHDAPAMTWDTKLAAAAQSSTDKCVWKHGGGISLHAGENLAAHSDTRTTIQTGIDMWINEEKDYDAKNPVASHYTQMIWKSSTKLGCAVTKCDNIEGVGFGGNFWACEYLQAGNVFAASGDRNEYFEKNVS